MIINILNNYIKNILLYYIGGGYHMNNKCNHNYNYTGNYMVTYKFSNMSVEVSKEYKCSNCNTVIKKKNVIK